MKLAWKLCQGGKESYQIVRQYFLGKLFYLRFFGVFEPAIEWGSSVQKFFEDQVEYWNKPLQSRLEVFL